MNSARAVSMPLGSTVLGIVEVNVETIGNIRTGRLRCSTGMIAISRKHAINESCFIRYLPALDVPKHERFVKEQSLQRHSFGSGENQTDHADEARKVRYAVFIGGLALAVRLSHLVMLGQ